MVRVKAKKRYTVKPPGNDWLCIFFIWPESRGLRSHVCTTAGENMGNRKKGFGGRLFPFPLKANEIA